MSIVACISCDASFEYSYPGRGRKRRKCFSCAPHRVRTTPKRYERRGEVRGVCPVCSTEFSGRAGRIYCGEACRDLNRGADCAGCGKRVVRSRTSADVQYCLDCRRSGKAPTSHGSSGYYRGCRCEVCREAKAMRMREYAARRKAEGRPLHKTRATVDTACTGCGVVFAARKDLVSARRGVFCSADCHNVYQTTGRVIDEATRERWLREGKRGSVRWRALRRAKLALELSGGNRVFVQGACSVCSGQFTGVGVDAKYCSDICREKNRRDDFGLSWLDRMYLYARDGWECHLCGLAVDPSLLELDNAAASLDHIVPRSHGGGHDFDNLRLAHRLCNSVRRDIPLAEFLTGDTVEELRRRLEVAGETCYCG